MFDKMLAYTKVLFTNIVNILKVCLPTLNVNSSYIFVWRVFILKTMVASGV